jgi:hypothetical protein
MKMNAAARKKILDNLVIVAAKYRQMSIELRGATNPQVIAAHHRSDGLADAFDAVLDAMKGDPVLLNLYAEK